MNRHSYNVIILYTFGTLYHHVLVFDMSNRFNMTGLFTYFVLMIDDDTIVGVVQNGTIAFFRGNLKGANPPPQSASSAWYFASTGVSCAAFCSAQPERSCNAGRIDIITTQADIQSVITAITAREGAAPFACTSYGSSGQLDAPRQTSSGKCWLRGTQTPTCEAPVVTAGDKRVCCCPASAVHGAAADENPATVCALQASDCGGASTWDAATSSCSEPAPLTGDWDKLGPFTQVWTSWGNTEAMAVPSKRSAPALVDLDDDGDLDLAIGAFDGTISYWRNDGTATAPNFVGPVTEIAMTVDGVSMARPGFFDFDGDGDLDLIVGGLGVELTLSQNAGTVHSPEFSAANDDAVAKNALAKTMTSAVSAIASGFLSTSVGDLDDDGDLDMVVGDWFGKLHLLENVKTQACHV